MLSAHTTLHTVKQVLFLYEPTVVISQSNIFATYLRWLRTTHGKWVARAPPPWFQDKDKPICAGSHLSRTNSDASWVCLGNCQQRVSLTAQLSRYLDALSRTAHKLHDSPLSHLYCTQTQTHSRWNIAASRSHDHRTRKTHCYASDSWESCVSMSVTRSPLTKWHYLCRPSLI